MADLSALLMPTRPIDVETRKKVFFSISRQGARQTLVKSGAIRFYDLNFQSRSLAEYEDLRDEWEAHYPDTVFQWSNVPLNTAGEDYYFDNNLTYTVNHPNNLDYKLSIRRKSSITVSTPVSNIIPHQPNFAEEIDELIRARIDDSVSFVRVSSAVAPNAKTYKLKFMDRTMEELLEMENFWAYHYPTRQVAFNDLVLELSGQLFYIDSDFKWQIERENSINYSFLIVAVPTGVTPYTLVSRSGYDAINLWGDSIALGFSALSLNLSDDIALMTDGMGLFDTNRKALSDSLNAWSDGTSRRLGQLKNFSESINNFSDAATVQLATAGALISRSFSDSMLNLADSESHSLSSSLASPLTVEESDASPTEPFVTKIIVPKNWQSEPSTGQVRFKPRHLLVFEFDGFGSVLTTSVDDAQIEELPWDCTILKWRVIEASKTPIASTCTIDLLVDSYANYPPTSGDSITGTGTKPNLSGPQTKNESSNFTNWASTGFTVGDVPRASLTAVTLAQKLRLVLTVEEL